MNYSKQPKGQELSLNSVKRIAKVALMLFMMLPLLATAQAIDRGNYFIAISHDGNTHDPDDILSAPVNIAQLVEVGLWDKVLHFEYNNNLGGDKQSAAMRESVNGALEKWGADKSKVFDLQTMTMTVSEAAKENFRKAAQMAYDKGAILYYCVGGPMEVPYQMVSNLSPELRKVVYAVGHGVWNQEFKRHPTSRDWTDFIKIVGGGKLILNQNGSYYNEPVSTWKWLNDKGGRYAWLYSRNQKAPDFDTSDSGLVYYVITGRGIERAAESEIKAIFNGLSVGLNPVSISSELSIYPNPASSILNIDFANNETINDVIIFNSIGQMVYNTKSTGENQKIAIKDLQIKGVALVQISTNGKIINQKIQIE